MAIVINGSGTVTGISVGGLPDGIVDAGTLATNSVDSAELIDGAVDNSHLADDAVDSDELAAGAVDAAHFASGVGGKVLQYKYVNFNYQQGTTSNTYSYVETAGSTDLSLTLTPSSALSIIVMQAVMFMGVQWVSGQTQQRGKVRFDWDIGGAGYNTVNTFGYIGGYNLANAQWYPDLMAPWLFHKVSGTTSAITFKIGFANMSSSYTGNFSINSDYISGSSVYMMEVTP